MQQGVWDLFFSSLAGFWNDREEQREESYSYTLHQQPSHGRPWAATSMAARRHGPSMTRAYPPARGRAAEHKQPPFYWKTGPTEKRARPWGKA